MVGAWGGEGGGTHFGRRRRRVFMVHSVERRVKVDVHIAAPAPPEDLHVMQVRDAVVHKKHVVEPHPQPLSARSGARWRRRRRGGGG